MDIMIILAIIVTILLLFLIVSPWDLLPGLPVDDWLYFAVIVIMWGLIAMDKAVSIYNELFIGQYGMLTGTLAVVFVVFIIMMIILGRNRQ